MNGNTYNFVCSIRNGGSLSKPTFSKGWIEFAGHWNLEPGDTITFYKEADRATGAQYKIRGETLRVNKMSEKGLEIPSESRQITIAALPNGQRIEFPVADVEGRSYTFVCSTNHPKPVFSDGWLKFVGDRGLKPGATITFYMEGDQAKGAQYKIRVLSPALSTTDFALQKGETKTITAPTSWGGRRRRRTFCSEDSTGKFSRLTGDCGSSKLECSGNGAAPPATLAEFKLDGNSGMDCFDVSPVNGYNLPMLVVPQGGSGQNCSRTGCVVDLNGSCP
ncbi:hypothetical protein GH714_020358 [Hevea brasiliensis]|uniref:TF-B3 domain-containing protein n=1 Tax=Hevea brasiliensis TaxID=3981 RepID=A0A6A6N398_HEVBR|nr:hypothetical protein GH714_020358 [Hevea brasiliensis]